MTHLGPPVTREYIFTASLCHFAVMSKFLVISVTEVEIELSCVLVFLGNEFDGIKVV